MSLASYHCSTPRLVRAAPLRHVRHSGEPERLFTRPDGALLDKNHAGHVFGQALRRAGLPHDRVYDCRHTYASLARKSGADLRYVQKTMGHSTPTVTANIYSDLYSDELDQVATNLDQLHATEIHTPKTGQEPDESN